MTHRFDRRAVHARSVAPYVLWLCCALSLALAFAAPRIASAANASTGPLQINEFLAGPARDWDGSGTFSSRDDEWIEVRNASAATIDLGGYILTDGDSIPRYAFSGVLGAGERVLVFGKTSYD